MRLDTRLGRRAHNLLCLADLHAIHSFVHARDHLSAAFTNKRATRYGQISHSTGDRQAVHNNFDNGSALGLLALIDRSAGSERVNGTWDYGRRTLP
jgi:hypothetical protein